MLLELMLDIRWAGGDFWVINVQVPSSSEGAVVSALIKQSEFIVWWIRLPVNLL